jgi:hypothetical protein
MSQIYIIEMPNKPPREVTNIKFSVVSLIVEKAGGKIYPKPLLKVYQPAPPVIPATPVIPDPFISGTKDVTSFFDKTYTWLEVLDIVQEIKEKYFKNNTAVMNCRVFKNNRMRSRLLGRAWSQREFIELASRLMYGKCSKYLKQVIYHELLHIKYPGQGHQGLNFRYEEKNNPFRPTNRTNKLSCVG